MLLDLRPRSCQAAVRTTLSLDRYMVFIATLACASVVSADTRFNEDFYTYPVGVVLKDGQKFDYIVAGAGAGGAAVSARLALAGYEVLLIEAGRNPDYISRIPSAFMALPALNMNWNYPTIPNNVSCLSSEGQQCRFVRGKCLGGSTSINHMLYSRGNRIKDFEDIPYPDWTFNDLMPYFLRYEGLQDINLLPRSSIPYHNTTGVMRTGLFNDAQNPWHPRLIESFKSLQFPVNPDVNAESQIGVTQVIGYVYRGERMSTARGYLARKDVKAVLKVAKNTMCTGVIVDKNKVARGVTATQGLVNLRLFARKEIILSAGAIGTPQILMLSGIGPADHLKSMSIPVKVNLPVGNRMTDHILPVLIVKVDRDIGIADRLDSLIMQSIELLDRRGALTSIGLTDVNVFANSYCYDFEQRRLVNESFDGSDCEVPNLQIIPAYIEKNTVPLVKPLFRKILGFKRNLINQLSELNKNYAFIVLAPVLLNPRSEGTLRLASKDPLGPPAIYPNYLADERDVDDILRSIGIVEHLVKTELFSQRNASLLHLNLPGCPRHEDDKWGYWRCHIRHLTYAVYHAVGTASLGSVVDARLRVFGVHGLRIADLSVLPRVPRGNTAAVSIAIGERAAAFILDDNK